MSRTFIEIVSCDTCRASTANRIKTSVVFLTEQTEGYPCKPHIEVCEIDLCDDCLGLMFEGQQVYAHGAQGHNTYFFKAASGDKKKLVGIEVNDKAKK